MHQILAGTGPDAEVELDRRAAIGQAIAHGRCRGRGGDRREGSRAGAGVRERPQGAVRRSAGGGGRIAIRGRRVPDVIDRPASWVAGAAGGEIRAGDPEAPGPARAVVDSRAVQPGDLFVGLVGERVDGGDFAPGGAGGGRVGGARRSRGRRSNSSPPATLGRTKGRWSSRASRRSRACRTWRARGGGSSAARRWGSPGSTGKTSTKDILAAVLTGRKAGPRQPREPQHRGGSSAVAPRGGAWHRGAGAGDGDARLGPDRRARGHRRAAGRGDRERRAGAPRAGGHRRGRGGRQGRADP